MVDMSDKYKIWAHLVQVSLSCKNVPGLRLIKVKSARINLTLLNNNNNNDVFCTFCNFTVIKKKNYIFWNFKVLLSFSLCFLSISIRESSLKNVH